MGVLTSQKIGVYYEMFKTIDVLFSKEIIQVSGLVPNQVYLKCVGDFWPCIIYSSSFQGAKIVVSVKSGILQKLERANNMVSLRFCFKVAEKGNPVAFFINAKSAGYAPYGNSKDVAIFSLQFTQRPPDDFIEIMGRILDANVNSSKRRDERIPIMPDSARKLHLASKESAVFLQGVPRNCIYRDISFSGAKIIMMGVAKFLVDKEASLRIDFDDPRESFLIKGKFVRSEAVEGRKELVALAMLFDEASVPMGYKIRVNDYLSVVRADNRISDKGTGDAADKKPLPEKKSEAPDTGVAPPVPAAPAKAEDAPESGDSAGDDFNLELPAK